MPVMIRAKFSPSCLAPGPALWAARGRVWEAKQQEVYKLNGAETEKWLKRVKWPGSQSREWERDVNIKSHSFSPSGSVHTLFDRWGVSAQVRPGQGSWQDKGVCNGAAMLTDHPEELTEMRTVYSVKPPQNPAENLGNMSTGNAKVRILWLKSRQTQGNHPFREDSRQEKG